MQAGTGYDPDEVLQQVRAQVLASSKRAPGYTCVETIERKYFRPVTTTRSHACPTVVGEWRDPALAPELRLASTDRLRLDVTMMRQSEIYSWVGASRFDAGIDTVVREGPVGSGAFDALLDMIFRTDVKQFRFEGHKPVAESDLLEYSFRVAQRDSHYWVKTHDSWVASGYSGSIFVEPRSGGVVRLRVEIDDPPLATGICQTAATLDFGTAPTGAAPFLLPAETRQEFLYPGGIEAENTMDFAACREYRGESAISFGPPASGLTGETGKNVEAQSTGKILRVDAGLAFTLELLERIDTDVAAAGDGFRARLAGALRDKKHKTLAPAGSIVEGRLRRVQSFVSPPQVYLVLAPAALWAGDERVPLAAIRDWSVQRALTGNPGGMKVLLPYREEGPAGVFRLPEQHVMVPAGFRSDWRTVGAAAAAAR